MMLKRWLAIVRAAETLGESTVIDGVRRLVVPLDAAHDDLPHGDTDYNRDWNRSLLNMLQRADAIAIMATETRDDVPVRSEEHTSELQSLMRTSYAVFCLKKKRTNQPIHTPW